jgi:hypothetical protein
VHYLVVNDDFPEVTLEEITPAERCDGSDIWKITLKLTLPSANLHASEWGSFNHGEGFNGVLGDVDIHDPYLLRLDPRVWQALWRVGKRIGCNTRYQWLQESCQLELILEGGEAIERFDLDTYYQMLDAEMR